MSVYVQSVYVCILTCARGCVPERETCVPIRLPDLDPQPVKRKELEEKKRKIGV
jgi:hypothetical protein